VPPLVSIVIPCYNGASYLSQAIESCLRQNYPALEVIIVDDASPDQCAEIAARFASQDRRACLARRKTNGGVSAAFNTGYDIARGVYLTRLAQDDWFEPDAIAEMASYLDQHPDIGLVYANEQRVEEKSPLGRHIRRPDPEVVLEGGNHMGLCVMWRKELSDKVGKFDSTFDSAEDYDYWERAVRHFRFGHLAGRSLLSVRFHPEMGSKKFAGRQEMLAADILARYATGTLAGRRAVAGGYLNAAYNYATSGDRRLALRCLWRALRYRPLDPAVLARLPGALRRVATAWP
jgi:glycosyltransferase involved in cell wall biosynthesis